MAPMGVACQAIPRWFTTPLAASPASFQPSNPAMATGEASSPMSLNSMIRHLPGSPQAVLLIAYVVSLAQWVTGRRVRCGPGNLYARHLEWPPMSTRADLGGTTPPRPPLITGGLPAPPYPPGPPTGGSGLPTRESGP